MSDVSARWNSLFDIDADRWRSTRKACTGSSA